MTIYTEPFRVREQQQLDEFEAPLGEVFGSAFAAAEKPAIDALDSLKLMASGAMSPSWLTARGPVPVITVSPDDAKARAKEAGVDVEVPAEGINLRTLNTLIDIKRNKRAESDALERAPRTISAGAARFSGAFLGSMADPLNIASAFVPVVGPTRYANMLAKAGGSLGRAGVRARVGAIEGTVGAALVEPLIVGEKLHQQADYEMADSLLNVAFGTAFGGGLHTGFGAISDVVSKWSPASRELAFRAALSQAIRGREVNVDPIARLEIEAAARAAANAPPNTSATEPFTPPADAAPEPRQPLFQPAGRQTHRGKPLHEMTIEELHAASKAAHDDDSAFLTQIFGNEKDAKFFARGSNSNSDAAYDRAQKMVDAMPPEKRKLIEQWESGIVGNAEATAVDIDALIRELDIPDASSPDALGRSLRYALTNIGDKTHPSEGMNTKELAAWLMLREANDIIAAKGWSGKEVSTVAIRESASRFYDADDAEFMLQRFLQKPASSTPAPATRALPAPGSARINVEGLRDLHAPRQAAAPDDPLVVESYKDPVEGEERLLAEEMERLNETADAVGVTDMVGAEMGALDEAVTKTQAAGRAIMAAVRCSLRKG